MLAWLKRWYKGEWKNFEFGPDSPLWGGQVERHWTARGVRTVVAFWFRHWQYIITTCIALIGLGIAWFKFSG